MFDNPPVNCSVTPNGNVIQPPAGGAVKVTPDTPLGKQLSPLTSSSSVLAGFCDYDIGELGDEDSTAELVADVVENGRVKLVMEASQGYPQLDSPYGVMIKLPGITDEIGVALQVVSANGQQLAANQKEWVIGTGGTILNLFEGGKVSLFTPSQQLGYLVTKIAPVTRPGKKLISGGHHDIFSVKWVIEYQGQDHVAGRTPISMSTGLALLTINAQGCSYQNVAQVLNKVRRTEFRSVGSTLGDTSFNIPISCYGGPSAKVSITPQHKYEQVQGVGLPKEMEAKGVGIQLLKGDATGDTPWDFSSSRSLDEAKATEDRVEIQIPLRARYYQLKKDVQAGPLQVVYTVTLSYD
ncbi:adhesin [Bordetella genomosp. 12]|uniref:Adhesin n=1 Tax=Bordetella genomosp. 12 TaxID=463035 RepID=A0A261VLJ5_9BORD|nr:adhesin [Bordetella genomosp. 12]